MCVEEHGTKKLAVYGSGLYGYSCLVIFARNRPMCLVSGVCQRGMQSIAWYNSERQMATGRSGEACGLCKQPGVTNAALEHQVLRLFRDAFPFRASGVHAKGVLYNVFVAKS